MPQRGKTDPLISIDQVIGALAGFDFDVDPEDFILYELARMIDEDRASFEDEEFRSLIDEGIREHIEENPPVRAKLDGTLRVAVAKMAAGARAAAERVIRALEDQDADLRNVAILVRTYTAYLLEKLNNLSDSSAEVDAAGNWIAQWRQGHISHDALIGELCRIGRPAVAPAADLLFDDIDDPVAAETAIAALMGIPSPASARVLAHVLSEPMLGEGLEMKAFAGLRATWPLGRPYILYNLRGHAHEDLPYRWFQLLIETNEVAAADLVVEELQAHGSDPVYHEDLSALVDLLLRCRDPELLDKILSLTNSPETPATKSLLEHFLREYKPAPVDFQNDPWARQKQLAELNRNYGEAARLVDSGRPGDALKALDEILAVDSEYPFALMLKALIEGDRGGFSRNDN